MTLPSPSQAPTVAPTGRASLESSRSPQHQLVVRYYRRMKVQRVYPMYVELRAVSGSGASSADPVMVRPIVPGASVNPAEQEVSPRQSGNRVTFYVTPLALGKLPEARVHVYGQGRLMQEVRTPMRVATQRLTWFLLLLTFLVPALLIYFTTTVDLSGLGPVEKKNDKPNAPAAKDKAPPAKDREKGPAAKDKGADSKLAFQAPGDDDDMPPPRDPPKKVVTVNRPIERFFVETEYLPDYNEYGINTVEWKKEAGKWLQETYNIARTMQRDNHLSFWVGVLFLGLTIGSWVTHRNVRGTRRGKPMSLPTPAAPEMPSDALSFNIPTPPMR